MSEAFSDFFTTHFDALLTRSAEHITMAATATLLALVVAVILSLLTYRRHLLRGLLLSLTSLLQTIPGMALLVMMMALLHQIGTAPAIATLFLFALLPLVQNTMVALNSLSPSLEEVARGLGMTKFERLRYVRLPLSVPGIIAGLRIAAVQTIGLTTLAAFIGAGGLGQFINRGLFLSDTRLILLGAIPAALIALFVDQLINLLEYAVHKGGSVRARRIAATLAGVIVVLLSSFIFTYGKAEARTQKDSITIGSKHFTEQLIVAEMVAAYIEQHTDLRVIRRLGLGGTQVLHQALVDGSIDLAIEYTGTALASVLHHPMPEDRSQLLPLLRKQYEQKFGLTWLDPLGFNNSYGLAIWEKNPALAGVMTITDLAQKAPQLKAAFDFEFAERADGYKGLQKTYGFHFKDVRDMHNDLMYPALKKQEADVISASTTDGRASQKGIRLLRDDKGFFPPYEAAIVVPKRLLEQKPALKRALHALSGVLNDKTIRTLNSMVDTKQMTVEQAAKAAMAGLR